MKSSSQLYRVREIRHDAQLLADPGGVQPAPRHAFGVKPHIDRDLFRRKMLIQIVAVDLLGGELLDLLLQLGVHALLQQLAPCGRRPEAESRDHVLR